MKHFKLTIIFLLFYHTLYSANIKPIISSKILHNAETALITIVFKNKIKNAKLSFNKQNLNFLKHPFKRNTLYVLLPISYYEKLKKQKIIISYIQNNNKIFKGLTINIEEGNYKSETINVLNSKVTLSKKDLKRTKKERYEAYKIYNKFSKNVYWEEDFILPIESKITSNFGTKRVYNNKLKSYHSGIDFKAKIGTKILASNKGIVKISQKRFYAGNSIVIDHGHGVYTQYYHLSHLFKKVGDIVNKGEVIGLSGKTGRVTGPHLHFSAKVASVTVEPKQLLLLLNSLND